MEKILLEEGNSVKVNKKVKEEKENEYVVNEKNKERVVVKDVLGKEVEESCEVVMGIRFNELKKEEKFKEKENDEKLKYESVMIKEE